MLRTFHAFQIVGENSGPRSEELARSAWSGGRVQQPVAVKILQQLHHIAANHVRRRVGKLARELRDQIIQGEASGGSSDQIRRPTSLSPRYTSSSVEKSSAPSESSLKMTVDFALGSFTGVRSGWSLAYRNPQKCLAI